MKGQLNDTELPPLLSIDQACTLLGVSRGVGYRAAASGDLPILRWSAVVRADRSAVGNARSAGRGEGWMRGSIRKRGSTYTYWLDIGLTR
jgi:hypothetical protein